MKIVILILHIYKIEIKHVLSNTKDWIPVTDKTDVLRKINCNDCALRYIGSTRTNLKTRI